MPQIDPNLCRNCGLCVTVCQSGIYAQGEGHAVLAAQPPSKCFLCGQCVAVCAPGAITLEGSRGGKEIGAVEAAAAEQLLALMCKRRSVRVYRDEPVPYELLEQIVQAAAAAPMCFPPTDVEVTVLTTREHVAPIAPACLKQVRELHKLTASSLGRLIFRCMAGAQAYQLIMKYLLPHFTPWLNQPGIEEWDFCTWGAPALLIFHQRRDKPTGETDCLLASTHAMLMAEALGLGSIMLGLASATIERDKSLRERYALPSGNAVYHTLAVGWPGVHFSRELERELKRVNWV